jgi:hypothetical protein
LRIADHAFVVGKKYPNTREIGVVCNDRSVLVTVGTTQLVDAKAQRLSRPRVHGVVGHQPATALKIALEVEVVE